MLNCIVVIIKPPTLAYSITVFYRLRKIQTQITAAHGWNKFNFMNCAFVQFSFTDTGAIKSHIKSHKGICSPCFEVFTLPRINENCTVIALVMIALQQRKISRPIHEIRSNTNQNVCS